MKFKKISAVLGTFLLTGLTLGAASAATFPAPFVDGGTADVAIVYGTGTGANDMAAAGDIQTALSMELGGTTDLDGTGFALDDSPDRIHFGEAINAIYTEVDDGESWESEPLEEGEYNDGDIDAIDYTQKITLGSFASALFVDEDELNNGAESIAFSLEDELIMTYTISFEDGGANISLMDETNMPLLGAEYYVLDAETDKITLLNSAVEATVPYGETRTIGDKEVSIEYIHDGEARFFVDGVKTDKKLSEGEYEKLDDGSYIVFSTDLGVDEMENSKAEVLIGTGRVVLEHNEEVQISDSEGDLDPVEGLTATITQSSGMLTELAISWTIEDEEYLAEGDSIVMPTFEKFGLTFEGIDFGETTEDIDFKTGDTLVLQMENFEVDVMYNTTSEQWLGNSKGELFVDATETESKIYYLAEKDMFLATVLDQTVTSVDQIYYKIGTMSNDTTTFDLSIDSMNGGENFDWDDKAAGYTETNVDDFDLEIIAVYNSGEAISAAHNASADNNYANVSDATALEDFVVLNVSHDTDTVHWDTVVSELGLVVQLPTTAGVGQSLTFFETDEDGRIETGLGGESFTVTTAYDSSDKLYATNGAGITLVSEDDTDKSMGYDVSTHATRIVTDSEDNTLEIEYYGDEVYAMLELVAVGSVSVNSDALGEVLAKDTDTVTAENLIVVGGSCINSAAATLLGGNYCGAAFTEATGVEENQFLIKGFENSALNGKFALLVAGYELADTKNAAKYLTLKDVDTSKAYKGTSANSADLITESM